MLGYLSRIGLGLNNTGDSNNSSQDSVGSQDSVDTHDSVNTSAKESSSDGIMDKDMDDSAGASSEFDESNDSENYHLKCKPPRINIGDDLFSDQDPSDLGSSYSGSNDADVENDNNVLSVMPTPSEETCKKIVELIEFYLSDTNLVKDMFLLKHVSKHQEGYVSVRLMTSYKKVKRITKDWNVVSQSLKTSKILELNEEGSKVRRRNPVQLDEQTRAFRTILAININKDEAQMDRLADLFGQYGEMLALQLHKPGGRIVDEVKQMEVTRPGITEKICAIVEYEFVYCARQALRSINNNDECNIEVIEIPSKSFLKRNKLFILNRGRSPLDNESGYFSASETDESSPNNNSPYRKNLRLLSATSSVFSSPSMSPVLSRKHFHDNQKILNKNVKAPLIQGQGSSSSHRTSLEPFSFKLTPPGSNPLPRRRQIREPSLASPPDSPYLGRRQLFNTSVKGSNLSSAPNSPWLRRKNRKESADSYTPDSSRCNSPFSQGRWTPCQTPTSPSFLLWSPCPSPKQRRRNAGNEFKADNVIRFPRGPDGTKGFQSRLNVQTGQA